tara:strand:+ start:20175 stop:20396 length:222 start_codon:yes stop_codon:yes gene_type:complete
MINELKEGQLLKWQWTPSTPHQWWFVVEITDESTFLLCVTDPFDLPEDLMKVHEFGMSFMRREIKEKRFVVIQ